MKYEIKPSIKLIYSTVKSNMVYGDTPILAYILFVDFSYSVQDILKNTVWSKGGLSRDIQKGLLDIKNPIKKLHRDLYIEKINEKFQMYVSGLNREVVYYKEIENK